MCPLAVGLYALVEVSWTPLRQSGNWCAPRCEREPSQDDGWRGHKEKDQPRGSSSVVRAGDS